jgi:hypothetical protein
MNIIIHKDSIEYSTNNLPISYPEYLFISRSLKNQLKINIRYVKDKKIIFDEKYNINIVSQFEYNSDEVESEINIEDILHNLCGCIDDSVYKRNEYIKRYPGNSRTDKIFNSIIGGICLHYTLYSILLY